MATTSFETVTVVAPDGKIVKDTSGNLETAKSGETIKIHPADKRLLQNGKVI